MTPQEFQSTVEQLRAFLPALDEAAAVLTNQGQEVAALIAHRDDLDREIATAKGTVDTLENQRAALVAQIADETKTAGQLREKRLREQAVSEQAYTERLEDLVRSEQAAKQRVAGIQAEGERLRAQQSEAHEQREAEHKGRVADLQKQAADAEARAKAAQDKVKALQGQLAGMTP